MDATPSRRSKLTLIAGLVVLALIAGVVVWMVGSTIEQRVWCQAHGGSVARETAGRGWFEVCQADGKVLRVFATEVTKEDPTSYGFVTECRRSGGRAYWRSQSDYRDSRYTGYLCVANGTVTMRR